jgi:ATP-binding cassette, subfamily C, bacterial
MTRLPLATAGQVRRAIGGYLRAQRGLAAATVLLAALAALAGLVAPWAIGLIVDAVLRGTTPAEIVGLVGLVAGAGVLSAVLTAISAALVARIGQRVLARMREDTVGTALSLPATELEESGRGDLLSRVGDDVAVISEAITALLAPWVGAALTVGLTMVGLFALDPWLAVAGLTAIPVYGFAIRWYLPRAAKRYAAERAAFGDRAEALVSTLEGLPTVRAYGAEEQHGARIVASSAAAQSISRGVLWFATAWGKWMNIAELVGLTAIIATGFALVSTETATVGAVTAAALYFHRLFNPLGLIIMSFDDIQSAFASLARIVGVIVCEVPAVDPAPRPPGSVTAEGITHRYGAEPVVREVSVSLSPNETVALVGASGAGKSTLAVILAGLAEPSAGTVRLGDEPVSRFRSDGSVVLVSQEAHVFAGPLAEDLRLARAEASDAEVEKALATVGADWVPSLPAGVHTVVGELGHSLSAEQAAQVALARALLADPVVLVLDEATAEAGSRDASRLEDAASAVLAGRTGLVVAHRLRQAASADRVLVMDAGEIVESGTHSELLTADGRYARLWRAWRGD